MKVAFLTTYTKRGERSHQAKLGLELEALLRLALPGYILRTWSGYKYVHRVRKDTPHGHWDSKGHRGCCRATASEHGS